MSSNKRLTTGSSRIFQDIAIFLVLAGSSVPYAWIDLWRIQGIPGVNYVAGAAMILTLLSARIKQLLSPGVLLASAVYFYLSLRGAGFSEADRWTEKLFLTDLLYSGMLICGMVLGTGMTVERLSRVMTLCFIVSTASLAGSQLLVVVGLIPSGGSGGRLFDPSQFLMHFWMLSSVGGFCENQNISSKLRLLGVALGLGVAISFAILGATRSSFIFTLTILSWLCVIYSRGVVRVLVILSFALTALVLSQGVAAQVANHLGELGRRFASEQARDDLRVSETTALLDQLDGSYFGGRGFGYAFYSPVVVKEGGFEELGVTPHIGLVAYLYKGGLLVWIPFLLALLVAYVRLIGFSSSKRYARTALGLLLTYTVVSLVSGGYGIVYMLLLGICLGTVFSYRDAPDPKT